ncbi:hypothetical protein POM88_004731 [Heracleum sosnowskyi]|uniref:Uncharacterized protein n=1 Tax=Heracleum sosnowskyi TaxID=360622 RepID=A0AAD8JK45_9APIA|nr:hypothetical protein POM88_004731 [Heracleum sosnowskyi]
MSSAIRTVLSIRRTILHASPPSSQTYNGFLADVSFTSVFNHPHVRTIKEGSGDMLGGVGDTAKPAVGGTPETGRSTTESTGIMGEKGMHTTDKTSAANTTKNISDRMIHEAKDKLDEEWTHQPTDSSAEDLTTREKGYD